VLLYVMLFIALTLASKTLEDVGSLDSMLASEWLLSMGIVSMFPRFMELTLEYGPLEGIIRFVPSIPGCMTMFTFINKSIAAAVSETISTGKAEYVSTGRPNANTHYSWRDCYFIHSVSHYYPAFQVCFAYCVYYLLAMSYGFDLLPMIVVLSSCALWLVAPILFCPQPTVRTIIKDLSEFWQFCIAYPDWSSREMQREKNKNTEDLLKASIKNNYSTLYEVWLQRELKKKNTPVGHRLYELVVSLMKLCIVVSVLPTAMIDLLWNMVNVFVFQLLLLEVWRLLYKPTALMLVYVVVGVAGPLGYYGMPFLDFAICVMVLALALRPLNDLLLLVAWALLRPNNSWPKMPDRTEQERNQKRAAQLRVIRYDAVVEYLFVDFQSHLQHLYCSAFILLCNLAVQSVLVLLEMCGGMHSYFLLNANLSGACGPKRRGYEPQPSFGDQPGTGQLVGRKRGSSLIRSILTHRPFRRGTSEDANIDVELTNVSQSLDRRSFPSADRDWKRQSSERACPR